MVNRHGRHRRCAKVFPLRHRRRTTTQHSHTQLHSVTRSWRTDARSISTATRCTHSRSKQTIDTCRVTELHEAQELYMHSNFASSFAASRWSLPRAWLEYRNQAPWTLRQVDRRPPFPRTVRSLAALFSQTTPALTAKPCLLGEARASTPKCWFDATA